MINYPVLIRATDCASASTSDKPLSCPSVAAVPYQAGDVTSANVRGVSAVTERTSMDQPTSFLGGPVFLSNQMNLEDYTIYFKLNRSP